MKIEAQLQRDGSYVMTVNGESPVTVESTFTPEDDIVHLRCNIDGAISSASVIVQDGSLHLYSLEGASTLKIPVPGYLQSVSGSGSLNDPIAPMPGVVERVLVAE